MIPLKDGTAWSALEYLRYLGGTEENKGQKSGQKAVVIPVGIAYCDKRKYRSRVVVQYVKSFFLFEHDG
jgi:glycerol-3-phosphate O-acyltransferase/dihydroxyacetone phosphate acyltransferase